MVRRGEHVDRSPADRVEGGGDGVEPSVNAVDQPDYCDFFTPALVNRAPVAVAIGTEGAGPVLNTALAALVSVAYAAASFAWTWTDDS